MDDAEKIRSELLKLRDLLKAPPASPKHSATAPSKDLSTSEPPPADQKVFPYVIQSGDTLDAIVLAYKDKNIKVTVAQILKANPGLKAGAAAGGAEDFHSRAPALSGSAAGNQAPQPQCASSPIAISTANPIRYQPNAVKVCVCT